MSIDLIKIINYNYLNKAVKKLIVFLTISIKATVKKTTIPHGKIIPFTCLTLNSYMLTLKTPSLEFLRYFNNQTSFKRTVQIVYNQLMRLV